MQIIQNGFKVFFNNKLLRTVYITLFCLINIFQLIVLTHLNEDILASFSQLNATLRTSYIYCAFFAFISFKFLYLLKRIGNDKTNQEQLKTYLGGLAVLLILNLIATLTLSLYNISAFLTLKVANIDVVLYIFKSMLLNFFLIALPSTLLGVICAIFFKKILAYTFLVLFTVLTSPLTELLAEMLLFNYNINLYPISGFLNFSTPSLFWMPNFMSGYSILPYRLELILVWIFALSAILWLVLLPKNNVKTLAIILSIGLCVTNAILYLHPSSKILMNSNPDEGLDADFWYYLRTEQKEEASNFDVISYDINMSVTNKLNVNAVLAVSDSLPEYKFTLYHGYKIVNVHNQDSKALNFKQEGDYFIVYNDSLVSEIVIEYTGYSAKFYSNEQGMVLPGFFPYYPHSGFSKIYSIEDQTYTKMELDNTAQFKINITGTQNTYSSLQKSEKNIFCGNATSVTIMSGFIKNSYIDGIEVIYPYLDTRNFTQNTLDDLVEEFARDYIGSDNINKVIILPSLNLKYMETLVLDDYVLARSFYFLAEICNESQK